MATTGDRIRQARAAARMSMRALAERAAPLSATAVSNYERGLDTPRPSVLLRLAHALNVPVEFFFRTTQVSLDCVEYRKRSDLGKWEQDAIQEQVREQLERYLDVESLFSEQLPEAEALSPSNRHPVRTVTEAEDAADWIRGKWHLGTDPIDNLPETLEDHGIKVLLVTGPDAFDGFSCWANGSIPVIVANETKAWDRLRSDAAHELGELVLQVAPGLDRQRAAQRFAGAFLAPRERVERELGRSRRSLALHELEILKEEYGLSMQAWVRRAYDCAIISEAEYTGMCRYFSANGLRKDERTPARAIHRPQRFRKLAYRAEAEGLITPIRRAELLGEVPRPSRTRPSEDELRVAAQAAGAIGLDAEDIAWMDSEGGGPDEQG